MTSIRQIHANRSNALKSTGPITTEGKQKSRCNAVRHGLTAETVIGALEDAEDYKAFEAAIIADYDAQSAVERELVLRLASLLWRLRRATNIETGLFQRQLEQISESNQMPTDSDPIDAALQRARWVGTSEVPSNVAPQVERRTANAAICFLELANYPNYPIDRLSRYEAILWRQAGQIIFTLDALRRTRRSTRSGHSFFRPRIPRLQATEEY
jgi:hypothetical protein